MSSTTPTASAITPSASAITPSAPFATPSASMSIRALTRLVDSRVRDVHARLSSIVEDARVVHRVVRFYTGEWVDDDDDHEDADANDVKNGDRGGSPSHGLPLLTNARCGVWYVGEALRHSDSTSNSTAWPSCYFKSTDGHCGHWQFSINRLNLHVAFTAALGRHWQPTQHAQHAITTSSASDSSSHPRGVIIVDSTRMGKRFPDSFSRTIPIWACVVNRAIARYRSTTRTTTSNTGTTSNVVDNDPSSWDTTLHTPLWVGPSEAAQIEQRLDAWVDTFVAAVPPDDLASLARLLVHPLRPIWMHRENALRPELRDRLLGRHGSDNRDDATAPPLTFTPLLLLNPSRPEREGREGTDLFMYMQGAADDEANWSRGLTPALFWQHADRFARTPSDEYDALVDSIVAEAQLSTSAASLVRHSTSTGTLVAPATSSSAPLTVYPIASTPSPRQQQLQLLVAQSGTPPLPSQISINPPPAQQHQQQQPLHILYVRTIAHRLRGRVMIGSDGGGADTTAEKDQTSVTTTTAVDNNEGDDEDDDQGNDDEDDDDDAANPHAEHHNDTMRRRSTNSAAHRARLIAAETAVLCDAWGADHCAYALASGLPKAKRSLLDILPGCVAFARARARSSPLLIASDDLTVAAVVASAILIDAIVRPADASDADAAASAASAPSSSSGTTSKNAIRVVVQRVKTQLPSVIPTRVQLKQLNRYFL